MVRSFIPPAVVGCRGPHKTKVYIEALSAVGCADGRALSSLFPDACLCLKVNEAEGVVVEFRRYAQCIAGEAIELFNAGRAKA